MRMVLFAKRNIKEILRDPVNLVIYYQCCYSTRSEKHDVSNKKSRTGLGNVRQRIYGIICRYAVIKRPHLFFFNAVVYLAYDCAGFDFRVYVTYARYDNRTSCNNLIGGRRVWA